MYQGHPVAGERSPYVSTFSYRLQGGWDNTFTSRNEDNSLTSIEGGGNNTAVAIGISSGISVALSIEGLTILNGVAENGGGICAVASGSGTSIKLELDDTTITGNVASNNGGGISIIATNGSNISMLI